MDTLFAGRPALTVGPETERKLRNGMTVALSGCGPGEYRVYGGQGTFLALGRAEAGRLTAIKSFFEV